MSREPAGSDKISAYRLGRSLSRRPGDLKPRNPPVLLRGGPCGCRVGFVVLDRYGWHIQGDRLQVPIPQWLERMRALYSETEDPIDWSLASYRAGRLASFEPGVVDGFTWTQPANFDEWEVRPFEVGCSRHRRTGEASMIDVANACRAYVACRKPQTCHVALT